MAEKIVRPILTYADEAHHSPANSYKKIMEYFTPKLWLGMTATPDKRDDNIEGRNVYEIFDHQIAYEIRLQEAMEQDMLCPFHYFGIHDVEVLDESESSKTLTEQEFQFLTREERVNHIIKQAKYYGYSGDRVKGLIFCSRVEESRLLSAEFNRRGYRTVALNGDADSLTRQNAFERLAMSEEDAKDDCQPLDYIFSVDILNEGVDIVEVNQVIMLRPTQSPIVFIQQLGRGLRKAYDKEYVVVLDFIGNYNNNFMIPIALSGDRTFNKDTIREYVHGGTRVIPGASTVHFDEISRERIFNSINKMSVDKRTLKIKYLELKDRLGRTPSVLDFYVYGEVDPMLFIKKTGTYDEFKRYADPEYKVVFTDYEEKILLFISDIIVNGKRIHELLALRDLLFQEKITEQHFKDVLEENNEKYRRADYIATYNVLSKNFSKSQENDKRYGEIEIVESDNGEIRRALAYSSRLLNPEFAKEVQDLIEYGLAKYKKEYFDHDEDNLVLYKKYSRKDVCRLLNWAHDDSSTVYGYRIKHNTCPIFVTYKKIAEINPTIQYPDKFEETEPGVFNPQVFDWWTRNNVKLTSSEAVRLMRAKEDDLRVLLFLKKSDSEGDDFYYMGRVSPERWVEDTISDKNGKKLPIVNVKLRLEHEARKDLFDYFTA